MLHLYRGVNQQKDILIIQGFKTILPKDQSHVRTFETHLYTTSDMYKLFENLYTNRCGHPFAKLYNTQIIQQNQIYFIEQIHYAEDVMFMLTYMCYIKAIQTLDGTTTTIISETIPILYHKEYFLLSLNISAMKHI